MVSYKKKDVSLPEHVLNLASSFRIPSGMLGSGQVVEILKELRV